MNKLETLYGVGVVIEDPKRRVLLGKRVNTIGEGTWAAPGGRFKEGESIEECAKREVLEETSMNIYDPQIFAEVDVVAYNCRLVTTAVVTKRYEGQPRIIKGGKHSEWRWFYLNELPEPLFVPAQKILEIYTKQT